MVRHIKCFFINVNSLVSITRRYYLKTFVDEHKPDILLLAEHKLSKRHCFSLNGYRIFIQTRDEGGGGTAVLVKERYRCERLTLNTGSIENCGVKVWRENESPIIFASLYLPPSRVFTSSDLDPLLNLGSANEVVIGMDLNAKHPSWGGTITNSRGRAFDNHLIQYPNFRAYPADKPTRPNPFVDDSYIDFFLVTPGLLLETNDGPLRAHDFESDHRAIEISILNSNFARIQARTFNDYNRMNIHRFQRKIQQGVINCSLPTNRNVTTDEIDRAIDDMSNMFREALETSVPKMRVGSNSLGSLPPRILGFIREKRRLTRILRRTGNPDRVPIIKADLRNIEKIIKDSIILFERDRKKKFLQNIRVNSATYRKVKMMAGVAKREPVGDLTDLNSIQIRTEAGKAELLADYAESALQVGLDDVDTTFRSSVESSVESIVEYSPLTTFSEALPADATVIADTTSWDEYGFVQNDEIGQAIKSRPSKKSVSLDGIPDVALKRAGNSIITFLVVLFNHCLNLGYFPKLWREAMMIHILKPGSDPSLCASYRPISLLSPFGKLFEFIILKRIRKHIRLKGVLKDSQFGFKPQHSTSHALSVFADYVCDGLNRKRGTLTVALDFSKAFDTVWHVGILHKMQQHEFSRQTCRLVGSFLQNRTFRVKVGEQVSNIRTVRAGVPQGSILGPILFNIYVSDIPSPPQDGILLTYADDVLVAIRGPRASILNNRMNAYMEELFQYYKKWGLKGYISKF